MTTAPGSVAPRARRGHARRGTERPAHGPMADSWQDPDTGVWHVALNDAGRAHCEEFLARYPFPRAMAERHLSGMVNTCRRCGIDSDSISAACLVAVAAATVRWRPGESSFSTTLHWGLRSELGKLIAERTKSSFHEVSASDSSQSSRGGKSVSIEAWAQAPSRESDFGATARAAELSTALVRLPARVRRVLEMRFGLCDNRPRTLEEIGGVLGISKERVRQIVLVGLAALERVMTGRALIKTPVSMKARRPESESGSEQEPGPVPEKGSLCQPDPPPPTVCGSVTLSSR